MTIFRKDLQDAMDALKEGKAGHSDALHIIGRIKAQTEKDEHVSKTLFRKIVFDADAFVGILDEAYAGLLDNPKKLTDTGISQRISDAKKKEEELMKDIKRIGRILDDLKKA